MTSPIKPVPSPRATDSTRAVPEDRPNSSQTQSQGDLIYSAKQIQEGRDTFRETDAAAPVAAACAEKKRWSDVLVNG